ncbi:MAG: hypothetical protein ABGY11_04000 [Candidatus Thioglobus sp.]|jgi:hypothetical protein
MGIKTYTICNFNINGKQDVTITEMSTAWGLSRNTLYSRLNRGIFDVKTLSRPVGSSYNNHNPNKLRSLKVEELIQKRNFYEPLSRLLLKTI